MLEPSTRSAPNLADFINGLRDNGGNYGGQTDEDDENNGSDEIDENNEG